MRENACLRGRLLIFGGEPRGRFGEGVSGVQVGEGVPGVKSSVRFVTQLITNFNNRLHAWITKETNPLKTQVNVSLAARRANPLPNVKCDDHELAFRNFNAWNFIELI